VLAGLGAALSAIHGLKRIEREVRYLEGLKRWIALLATIAMLLLSLMSGLISAAPVTEKEKPAEELSIVESGETNDTVGKDSLLKEKSSDPDEFSGETVVPVDNGLSETIELLENEGLEISDPDPLSLEIEPETPKMEAMASVTPVLFDPWTSGNAEEECKEAGCSADYAYKINAAAPNGTYPAGAGNTITISGSNGKIFNWASIYPVSCVIVKASTKAYVYYYPAGAYSDTGLIAPEGKDISHVTFCFNSPVLGSICGTKWEDYTCDDQGDVPVDGVTIILLDAAGAEVARTVTADGGKYCFTGLPLGDYVVKELLDPGWYAKNPASGERNVHLGLGDSGIVESGILCCPTPPRVTGVDFVNARHGKICGTKWEDLNCNSEHDEGEPPVDGVTIVLLDATGAEVARTVTADGGKYCFDGLALGDYTVKELLDPGWYAKNPASGERQVHLGCGDSGIVLGIFCCPPTPPPPPHVYGVDFINARYLSICGMKWEDYTCDGIGDEPVDGVTIILLDAAGAEVARTVTADGGKYCFTGLKPGTYTVMEDLSVGDLDEDWYPKNPASGMYEGIELVCGQPITGLDFVNARYLSICGHKWEDLNCNGEHNEGEPPVEGVTIELWQYVVANGSVSVAQLFNAGTWVYVTETVTAADGSYCFTDLKPGLYKVKEVLTGEQAEEWYFKVPASGEIEVTLRCGEPARGVDFVNARYLSISGTKWDGCTDDPVEGILIELWKDGAKIAECTTDENGAYSFTGLMPGTYTVKEALTGEQLAEWYMVSPEGGIYEDITLVCGQPIENLDFINARYGSICGHKWEDLNCDGQHEEGEPPVEGVTIELWQYIVGNDFADAAPAFIPGTWVYVTETLTAADGSYCFTDLKPGLYKVKEVLTGEQAEEWYFKVPASGEIEVPLECGQSIEGVDFVNARYGSISGTKLDGSTEESVPGILIELWKDGEKIAEDITDENGAYSFTGLMPGTYTVKEALTGEQLAEWYVVSPEDGVYEGVDLECGEEIVDLDFVNCRYGSISGTKWEDLNADGNEDEGEPEVAGVTIVLLDEEGNKVTSDITDSEGNYSFTGLKSGTYTVMEELTAELLAEWYIVYPDEGVYKEIVVVCGQDTGNIDFFNARYRKITGYKYNDVDGNGDFDPAIDTLWDGSDIPITITLYQGSTVIDTYVIDSADGMYEFTGLLPGDYTIEETYPEGEGIQSAYTSIDVTLYPDADLVVEKVFLNFIVEAEPIIIVPVEPQVQGELPATGLNQLPLIFAAGLLMLLGLMALMLGIVQMRKS
jgi:protocatechuate 3,4-dioxygenase beta subunit